MIVSLRRLAAWARFLTMFVILTMIFYHVIAWVSQWFEPAYRYGQPKGPAVKVFAPSGKTDYGKTWIQMKDRVLLYYWLGE
ncbi:DUF4227 family protein [Melghirimyces algeriensis]|nr:DUF4227 family protein [Melghirimyces algeriensis]